MGLGIAAIAFQSESDQQRVQGSSGLVDEAERRVVSAKSDLEIEASLAEFKPWVQRLSRFGRRWIARIAVRVMEVMVEREDLDGTKQLKPDKTALTVIDRSLAAMGFTAADREPHAPPGGVIELSTLFTWWQPSAVNLALHLERARSNEPEGDGAVLPPESHGRNVALVSTPSHFAEAVDWYAAHVLPFIEDDGGGSEWRHHPDIGRSYFSTAVPYERQPETTRLFFWALADAMLVATQARGDRTEDPSDLQMLRLPLIRAIYEAEVEMATRAALGLGPGDEPPDLGDPLFVDYATRRKDVADRIEVAMRRVLRVSEDGRRWIDELSALQVAMTARAARVQTSSPSGRAGCWAPSALIVLCLAASAAGLVWAL